MEIELEGTVAAPLAARRFVQEHWRSLTAGEVAASEADAALVVSELVTNAVQAGAAHITVQIHVEEGSVALRVIDDAAGWPEEHHSEVDDVRGRGLFITAQVADHWTATRLAVGKAVSAAWERRSS